MPSTLLFNEMAAWRPAMRSSLAVAGSGGQEGGIGGGGGAKGGGGDGGVGGEIVVATMDPLASPRLEVIYENDEQDDEAAWDTEWAAYAAKAAAEAAGQ